MSNSSSVSSLPGSSAARQGLPVRLSGAAGSLVVALLAAAIAVLVLVIPAAAEEQAAEAKPTPAADDKSENEDKADSGSKAAASGLRGKYSSLVEDATTLKGLLTLYRKDDAVYAEIPKAMLGREFFVLISIARGIGERSLLGGMSWGSGDDWVWEFRKVDDTIHVVRRNVRFFADKGSPEAKAVDLAYTDSVLYSVPIAATSPSGGQLIDLSKIFFTDLPRISARLPGFSFAKDRTTWASVKAFDDNVEIEVAATYGSNGSMTIDTVPDSRGATVNVHYSLSLLPQNDYTPRLADDRVGYFVTALKDFSQDVEEDRFVRYINRWQLEKADPDAEVSPPKKPIVFWIEKTVPFEYRQPIRSGIEAWNEAFEKAGFATAIEVRQQPEATDWDPEDVNYNTFRWITSGAGFAMGPSRVNPRTGQILDADIIFDADFLQFWRTQYETFTPAASTSGERLLLAAGGHRRCTDDGCGMGACRLFEGHARETAIAAAAIQALRPAGISEKEKEKLVRQGLELVAMHEVGHTLGLRHNFKGSAYLSLAEINDVSKTNESGASTSVMDYLPANIMPTGRTQGNYYTPRLGGYDLWAIEYGYKPLPGGTQAEREALEKIASRSGEPLLAYATDEDTESDDPDPFSNRFDLGKDPLEFARVRAELVAEVMPLFADRLAESGGYKRVRQAFGVLLAAHGRAMQIAARLVGGLETSRSHKSDPAAPPPFRVIPAETQREAVTLLEKQLFGSKPFDFPPELYNQLATTPWLHWGMSNSSRADYPVHDVILSWQERVLDDLLSPLTLSRIIDNELKVPADEDAFTAAELMDRLTAAIIGNPATLEKGDYTNRKPAIPSLRRALQRAYLARLSAIALGRTSAPADCEALASSQLRQLLAMLDDALGREDLKLDAYSRAHLEEARDRIDRVLDADILQTRP